MFLCPRCQIDLKSVARPPGRFLRCRRCRGRACTVGFLRGVLARSEVNRVWATVYEQRRNAGVDCPSCRRDMSRVSIRLSAGLVHLDGCRSCQLVWFDGSEFDRFTPLPDSPAVRKLPDEARVAKARVELARLDRIREHEQDFEGVDEAWKIVPAVLGLPVEKETSGLDRPPWATWTLAACILVVTVATQLSPEWVQFLGWIPADPFRQGGLTLVTSFFVHAGFLHLLGNLYFLLTFGDDVESLLGSVRFLVLLVLAELGAAIGHLLLAPDPTVPTVGASGGISGLLAYYACRQPHARIALFFIYYARPGWATFPAWGAFGFWVVLQQIEAMMQVAGWSTVSAGAHLGGAAVGLLLGLLARRRS